MFKRIFTVVGVLAVLSVGVPALAEQVNGKLWSPQLGQRVLHVWGTDYEMGYAHGYLLADDVMDMIRLLGLPGPMYTVAEYNDQRAFLFEHFVIRPELEDEAQGLYDGLVGAGVDLWLDDLGRDLDADDIVAFTALRELAGFQCSTWAAWGSATDTDPNLDGALVIGHNSDFVVVGDDQQAFEAGSKGVIFAFDPSDPDRQRYVSVIFPGFLGFMAGMNDSGIGLFVNRGAIRWDPDQYDLDPKPDMSISLSREAVALRDFNDDGQNDIKDVGELFVDKKVYGPGILQAFGPGDRTSPPSAVLEINNLTRASRFPWDDDNFAPDMLLSLNWEDKLNPVRQGYHALRYQYNVNLIDNAYGREATVERMWDFLYQNGGAPGLNVTYYSIVIVPAAKALGVSLWSGFDNDPRENHVWYAFDDLFADDDTDDDTDDDADDDADDDTVDDDGADDDDSDDDTTDDAPDDDASGDDAEPDDDSDVDNGDDSGGDSSGSDDAACGC